MRKTWMWLRGSIPTRLALASEKRTWGGLVRLARSGRLVAWGEIGLDFHYSHSAPPEEQAAVFSRQLALAREVGLPVVIHTSGGRRPDAGDSGPALRQWRFGGCDALFQRQPGPWPGTVSKWGFISRFPVCSPFPRPAMSVRWPGPYPWTGC